VNEKEQVRKKHESSICIEFAGIAREWGTLKDSAIGKMGIYAKGDYRKYEK
jgi:hypothetical protein